MISSACVFCGARFGKNSVYEREARALGEALGQARITLVYGGGHVGLMGAIADSALNVGGDVIGVIPQGLVDRELAFDRVTRLHVTASMHERKAMMADLSEAFIALPGGYGTLDELCEILTWAQLGIHHKPIILLNTAGYYNGFLKFIESAMNEEFIPLENKGLLRVASNVSEVLAFLGR